MVFGRNIGKLISRLRKGDFKNAVYLTYYYFFLYTYSFIHKKNFANSQTPSEVGLSSEKHTGNFPAHPNIIHKILSNVPLRERTSLCDIGCGSGIILYVAHRLHFKELMGIELSPLAYDIAKKNVGDIAILKNSDALKERYDGFNTLAFFKPFPGDYAIKFFEKNIPETCTYILTGNVSDVYSTLKMLNFTCVASYQHYIYKNFEYKLWRRKGLS